MADTWFAVTTTPINVPLLTRHDVAVSTFGRDLNPQICGDNNLTQQRPCVTSPQLQCTYPCSVQDWNFTSGDGYSRKEGTVGAEESAKTLLSNSEVNLVQNISNPMNLSQTQWHYLQDSGANFALDFMANTTAVNTQCRVVTQDCTLNSTDEGFTCGTYSSSLSFSGQVGVDPATAVTPADMASVGIQFFNGSSPIGRGNSSTQLFPAKNTLNFLLWSKGFPPIDTSSYDFSAMRSGNYLKVDHAGDNVFIVNCTSIDRATYVWANSTVLGSDDPSKRSFFTWPAADAYGAIYAAPFAMNTALGHVALQNAAALAAYLTTPDGLAIKFANEFSRAAVALTAGVMTPVTSMIEQSRNDTELLTRVPKAPLFFLVSLNAIYAIFSITIALAAAFLSSPSEAQEVKARLSVDGLAVGVFETKKNQAQPAEEVHELFGEHQVEKQQQKLSKKERKKLKKERKEPAQPEDATQKVGMTQTSAGGWVFVAESKHSSTWKTMGSKKDGKRDLEA